jgi:hypothetical protein
MAVVQHFADDLDPFHRKSPQAAGIHSAQTMKSPAGFLWRGFEPS